MCTSGLSSNLHIYIKYFLSDPIDPPPNDPTLVIDTPVYEPSRKRFKPSKDEEDILRADQAENAAMAKAYERAVQFKTSLKAIITWHEKHTL